MVVEKAQFKFHTTYISTDFLSLGLSQDNAISSSLPMLLNWAIGNTTCDIAQKNKSSYTCKSDHSFCLNSPSAHGGYLYNCSNGYKGNPYLDEDCQDIDECENKNACSKPGRCHNFQGEYRCSCPFGWQRNHNNPKECSRNVAPLIGV